MTRIRISLLAALLAMPAAHAAVDLAAVGNISGSYEDFATETAGSLENGIPGNRLGGMGSGLAYAGGTTFLALPDRGPNAKPYNSAVDDTVSYISRFHTVNLSLAPNDPGASLPLVMTPMLQDTTLLFDRRALVYGDGVAASLPGGAPEINTRHRFYFSGRSDNFDAAQLSTNALNGRLDPESIRVSSDGQSVYLSDEYGPYVYEFDRDSGERKRVFALPAKFAVPNLSAKGDTEIAGNTVGRVANKGMEGLAISPNGKVLFGVMQSPLAQDGGTSGAITRIVRIDLKTGKTAEYAYELTNIGTAAKPKYPTISDIVAVNDHQFLLDERDGKGLGDNSTAVFKRVYFVDIAGAVDVSNLAAAALLGKAAPKSLFLDIVAALNAHGVVSNDIPAKLEGIAFGPDVEVDGMTKHTLYVSNDNDYIATVTDSNHPFGIDNPNLFYVFTFDHADLPGLVLQQIDLRGQKGRYCPRPRDRD